MSDTQHASLMHHLKLSKQDLDGMSLDELGHLQSVLATNVALLENRVALELAADFNFADKHPDGAYWVDVVHKQGRSLYISARCMKALGNKLVESSYQLTIYISGDPYASPSIQLDYATNTEMPTIEYARSVYERCNEDWVTVDEKTFDEVVDVLVTTYKNHNEQIAAITTSLIAQVYEIAQFYKN